jgi:hypothetical protein
MVLGVPSGTDDPDYFPNLVSGGKNCPRSPDNGISEVFGPRDSEGGNCGSNPIPWYGGEAEPELPDVSGCGETTASITAIVVEWGRGHNFKPVRYGGDVGRVRFVCGCGGRMVGPRKVSPATGPSNTRKNVTKYALPGQARCPFRLNYRWHAQDKCWSATKFEPAHNHPPTSDDVAAFIHRTGDLTGKQRSFLASCVKTNLSPQQALHLYHELYPDAPPLTRQDVANLSDAGHVGSQDEDSGRSAIVKKREYVNLLGVAKKLIHTAVESGHTSEVLATFEGLISRLTMPDRVDDEGRSHRPSFIALNTHKAKPRGRTPGSRINDGQSRVVPSSQPQSCAPAFGSATPVRPSESPSGGARPVLGNITTSSADQELCGLAAKRKRLTTCGGCGGEGHRRNSSSCPLVGSQPPLPSQDWGEVDVTSICPPSLH